MSEIDGRHVGVITDDPGRKKWLVGSTPSAPSAAKTVRTLHGVEGRFNANRTRA